MSPSSHRFIQPRSFHSSQVPACLISREGQLQSRLGASLSPFAFQHCFPICRELCKHQFLRINPSTAAGTLLPADPGAAAAPSLPCDPPEPSHCPGKGLQAETLNNHPHWHPKFIQVGHCSTPMLRGALQDRLQSSKGNTTKLI